MRRSGSLGGIVRLALAGSLAAFGLAGLTAQSALAQAADCSAATARPASIARLVADKNTDGSCVRLEVLQRDGTLYDDAGGLYISFANDFAEEVAFDSLSLAPERIADQFKGAPRWLRVVGVFSAESERIEAVSVETLSRRPARLTGDRNRERFGDLALIAPSWRAYPRFAPTAARWMAAVQTAEPIGLAQVYGASDTEARFALNDPASNVWQLRHDASSPFAVFRGTTALPQMAMFMPQLAGRPMTEEQAFDTAENYESAIACFCRVRDCSRLWPISLADATADVRRPYACISLAKDNYSGKGGWRFTFVDAEDSGLAEP